MLKILSYLGILLVRTCEREREQNTAWCHLRSSNQNLLILLLYTLVIISRGSLNFFTMLVFGNVIVISFSLFLIGWVAKRAKMFRGRHTPKVKKGCWWTEERGINFYKVKFSYILIEINNYCCPSRWFLVHLFPVSCLGHGTRVLWGFLFLCISILPDR